MQPPRVFKEIPALIAADCSRSLTVVSKSGVRAYEPGTAYRQHVLQIFELLFGMSYRVSLPHHCPHRYRNAAAFRI